MHATNKWKLAFLMMLVTAVAQASAPISKFDEFGDLNCENEWSRLDNFAIQLTRMPQAKGYIIFYGGKFFRGRLPRRGEAAARRSNEAVFG